MTGFRNGLKRWLSGAAMALALAAGPALADGVLDRGIGSEWSSLDPQVNFDAAAGWIMMDAYEGLVTYGPGGGVQPGAAESWTVSEDGKTYTFTLREGLKWSNGDPIKAQEFVDSVMRTLNPETVSEKGYYFYSVVKIKGAEAIANGEAKDASGLGVTAPDDRTVVIEMETPAPHILNILGAFQIPPLHGPSYAANGAAGFTDPAKVVSNGAYVFTEIVPQSHVLLSKNPNYWDAANVKIEQVKYHVTEDVSTEYKRFQAGEIDITYDIPVNQIEEVKASIPIRCSSRLDRDHLLQLQPDEAGVAGHQRADGAVAGDQPRGSAGEDRQGRRDPGLFLCRRLRPHLSRPDDAGVRAEPGRPGGQAKELLAAAGYGPDNPLKLTIVTTVAEDRVRLAQGVSLMWKQVLGVEAAVEPMERKAWLDAFYAGTWDVFADNLVGDFAGAETFLAYMRPSAEPGYNWVKPEYDAQMDVAATMPDAASRNAELAKAEKILLDDVIFAPLAKEPLRRLVSPKVKGYTPSVTDYVNTQFLSLEP